MFFDGILYLSQNHHSGTLGSWEDGTAVGKSCIVMSCAKLFRPFRRGKDVVSASEVRLVYLKAWLWSSHLFILCLVGNMVLLLKDFLFHICMAASDKHMVSMTDKQFSVAGFLFFPCWLPPKHKF
jgi:hypothetical protein